jgi:hypothetical protein
MIKQNLKIIIIIIQMVNKLKTIMNLNIKIYLIRIPSHQNHIQQNINLLKQLKNKTINCQMKLNLMHI